MRFLRSAALAVFVGLGSFGLVASDAALAQSENDDRLNSMIDEVRAMLDQAEKERLADPWFIQDMRDLLARYDWPWSVTVYDHTFDTASRQPPEPWKVHSGRFRVDGSLGLRSVFYPPPPRESARKDEDSGSSGEQFGELLGAIIKESLSNGDKERRDEPEQEVRAALTTLPVGMANAFAVRAQLSVHPLQTDGQQVMAFGPYQGQDAVAGYRLVYRIGEKSDGLSLVKRSPNGTVSTVEYAQDLPDLRDGNVHDLLWTRNKRGGMEVTIDGKTVIKVRDRGFNDRFAGLVLRNEGGDYAFRSIAIQEQP